MPNATVRAAATGLPSSSSKAAFLAAVLEPITTVDLLDFGYSRDMRRARERQWRLAFWALRRAKLMLDYQRATECYREAKGRDAPRSCRDFSVLLPRLRAAQALLLRTPAPDEAALSFKRAVGKDAPHIPFKADELTELIAADVAFLVAHPLTRRSAAKSPIR